jgi:hypothetical protein
MIFGYKEIGSLDYGIIQKRKSQAVQAYLHCWLYSSMPSIT